MPRRPRIHLPDLPLHVVQRGHNRDACFFVEGDYLAHREWLGETLKATSCQLHALVPMTSHVHLSVTRYVHPDTFKMYEEAVYKMGAPAPMVRSSYWADQQAHTAGVA